MADPQADDPAEPSAATAVAHEPAADGVDSNPPLATGSTAPEEPKRPPRTPGPIRWLGLVLLLAVVAVTVLIAEFLLAPWIADRLERAVTGARLALDPGTRVHASILGASAGVEALLVHDQANPDNPTPFTASELTADLGVWATVTSGDLVVDRLAATGIAIDLRRRPDGSVPGLPPEVAPPAVEPPPGEESEPVDWVSLALRWRERYQSARDWYRWYAGEGEGEPPPPPPPTPDDAWKGAVTYPVPPVSGVRPARTLIRALAVTGARFRFPDAIGGDGSEPTGFDIEELALTAQNLTWWLLADEEQRGSATAATAGAGSWQLQWQRTVAAGQASLAWAQLPIELVADEQVAGERLAKYRPRGTVDIVLAPRWRGETLAGQLILDLQRFRLDPTPKAEPVAHDIARALASLPTDELRWTLELGGTVAEPQVIGFDLAGLGQAVADSLVGEARRQLEARLGQELDTIRDGIGDKVRDRVGDKLRGVIGGNRGDDQEPDEGNAVDRAKDKLKDLFGGSD